MKVGVFDSGIGGLTVLKNLYKHYPNNEYIYYGDTKNLPYGNKTKEELNELSSNDIEFLISKKVDVIFIACGTVSSNCIHYLKNKYDIPIYDIITPTINYLNNSNYKNIGIIATNATISSHVFEKNLNKFVYEIKTPDFVPIIENNQIKELPKVIDKYLKEYKDKIDILVLGCTHYPLIKDNLNKYLGNHIPLLDMSELLLDKLKDNNNSSSSISIYYSKLNKTIIENTKNVLNINNLSIFNTNNKY